MRIECRKDSQTVLFFDDLRRMGLNPEVGLRLTFYDAKLTLAQYKSLPPSC